MNYKINSLCLLALKVGNLISDLPFSFTRGREAKMENEEIRAHTANNGSLQERRQETKVRWQNQMARRSEK